MKDQDYESDFVKVGKSLSQLWGIFFSRKPKKVIQHVKIALRENRNKEKHPDLFTRLAGTILVWRHTTHVLYGHEKKFNLPARVRLKLLQNIVRSFNYLLMDAKVADIEMLIYLYSELPDREGHDNPLLQLLELKILELDLSPETEDLLVNVLANGNIDELELEWKVQYERLTRTYRLRVPSSVYLTAYG